jgi:predicted membrane-bound spermidine synthase
MTPAYWLFALSGLAGLIYEVVWTRYLALFVGHSAFAQAIVLIVFLGGMALGAGLVADRSRRIAHPLRAYALVEGGLGFLALIFHPVFHAVTGVAYDTLLPRIGGGPLSIVVQWALAALLIIPQSVLLGMTFPLMSSAVLRRGGSGPVVSNRPISLLYFANSLGAAIGVLCAGFFLIGRVGLHATLLVAGTVNLAVAAAAWGLHRVAAAPGPISVPQVPDTTDVGPESRSPQVRRVWLVLLAASAGTAVASYVYEIAWTRLLALLLGSATHAFELMLSAFILGLALGALWSRRRVDAARDPVTFLVRVQFAMGTLALATIPVYLALFPVMAWLVQTLPKTSIGYLEFNLARYSLALAVMLPATFCAGMTLPLMSAVLLRQGQGERTVGAVYSANACGSILGVWLGALVLMPLLGLRGLLVFGGAVDVLVGVLLLLALPRDRPDAGAATDAAPRWSRGVIGQGLIACLAIGMAVASGRFDSRLLASGVFRSGELPDPLESAVIEYVDGRTASVSVRRYWTGDLSVATNGKVDASIERLVMLPPETAREAQPALSGDASTQVLLPLITLAHAPGARRAVVIGHGSGQSGHLLLAGPQLTSLTTVEIEPEMVRASRYFAPVNWRVFKDPRSRFVVDDARAYFAGSRRPADLILSEPSNPWVSGVSGLFTVEFYRRIRASLAPGGVFGQWMHLYESTDAMFLSVLAAVHQVFADYRVYLTSDGDALIVAAAQPLRKVPDWSVFELPQVRQDLRWYRPIAREHLEAGLLLDRSIAAPLFVTGGPQAVAVNMDDHPRLDAASERARFIDAPVGLTALAQARFDLPAALAGWVRPFGRNLRPTTGVDRSTYLVAAAGLRGDVEVAFGSADLLEQHEQRRERMADLRAGIASGVPPRDWSAWCVQALRIEAALHRGTMGVIDTAFYRSVLTYARDQGAPEAVQATLAFRQAVARYDWATAVALIDRLSPVIRQQPALMPPSEFREAATVALLKAGQPARAAALFAAFRGTRGERDTDISSRLLAAHLTRALGTDRALAGPFAQ